MGAMSELDLAVRDLKAAGAALNAAADSLVKLFSTRPAAEAASTQTAMADAAAVETSEKAAVPHVAGETEMTLEDVRGILAGICAQGYGPQVKKLISEHGGKTLGDVPKGEYLDLVMAAKALCGEV